MIWAWDRILGERDRIEQQIRDEQQALAEPRENEGGPPPRECRVCGHEGLERFCPHCLADTMVEKRRT